MKILGHQFQIRAIGNTCQMSPAFVNMPHQAAMNFAYAICPAGTHGGACPVPETYTFEH